MPRAAPSINRFNAGKLSSLISARTDPPIRPYYDAGAQVLKNWLPMVEGPMIKRSGFKYVKPASTLMDSFRLIPFYASESERFMLEFAATATTFSGDVRFLKDGAGILEATQAIVGSPTIASPVSVEVTGHAYATGEEVFILASSMTELNGRYFTITVTGANSFTLDGEDGTSRATGAGGTAARSYELRTFFSGDMSTIQRVQNQDLIFVCHGSFNTLRLRRTTDANWDIDFLFDGSFEWPIFEFDDTSGVSIQASADIGTITLTASSAIFDASHVGRKLRLTDTTSGIGPLSAGGGEGFVEITVVTAPPSTTATAIVRGTNVLDPQVVSTGTTRWAWSVESNATVIAYFDERLWLSGFDGYPGEFWASQIGVRVGDDTIGSYEAFARLTTDVGALHSKLNQGTNDAILWMEGIDEALIVGTSTAEHTISSLDPFAALAAGNIKARKRSQNGSYSGIEPVLVNNRVVFSQRAGRKLRDYQYLLENNDLVSTDLTRLSREISVRKFAELAYQQEPNQIVWSRMKDGTLAALTYEYTELVVAWTDIELGGTGSFLSNASLPSELSTSDELWAVVERTIGGGTSRNIEQLQPFWERGDAIVDAFFLDSAILYDGSAATAFTGAHHLEGETVAVFADGFRVEDVTIVDGSFTLTTAASKVLVGYPYVSQYLSMPLEGGAADGTSQGKPGSIARVTLRLDQTGEGLSYGARLDDLRSIPFREVGDPMDAPVPIFDGDKSNLTMPMNQTTRRTLALEHDQPLPCTVVGAFPRLESR